jgi:hypothetical protein
MRIWIYKRSYLVLSALNRILVQAGFDVLFWGGGPFRPARKSCSSNQMPLALLVCGPDNSLR